MPEYSFNSHGERFPLPEPGDYAAECDRLEVLVGEARDQGKAADELIGG